MDVRSLKYPARAIVEAPGLTLELRSLSPSQIERACLEADRRCRYLAWGSPGWRREEAMEQRVQILAASARVDPHDIRGMHPSQIEAIYITYELVQRASEPRDINRLKEWLRRRVNDDPQVMLDGSIASMTESPVEYYGLPMPELTLGQIAYWRLLKSAHAEWHTPDEKGRYQTPTKQWLNSDA